MVNRPDPSDVEIAVLERLWPGGAGAEDVRTLQSLPAARRAKVVSRLEALATIEELRRDNPRAQVDLRSIARGAGLTPDGLVAIRRKWAASRTVASVVPYLGRAERQPTQRGDDDPVVVAARELIADPERAGDPDSVVASELRRRFGLSVPVLVRLVRRLRRDDATDPARAKDVFGRALLVDVCAVDRVTAEPTPRQMVCAVVVERASGLILGHEIAAMGDDTILAQARAVLAAEKTLADGSLDRRDGPTRVELTLGDGSRLREIADAAARLKFGGEDLRVNSLGPRRYGQRLVSLLGKRMGRLWWRPRSSSPLDPTEAAGSEMTLSDAAVLVAAEVADHNADVEARLAQGGIARGWGVSDGTMAAALRDVRGLLAPAQPSARNR